MIEKYKNYRILIEEYQSQVEHIIRTFNKKGSFHI